MSYTIENFKEDMGVSRETAERLEAHLALLRAWAPRINLVGPTELEHYWQRHALDSAQLIRHAGGALRWLDMGSGAGFPGLVLACLLTGQGGAEITLVEPSQKRVSFLREAIRATGAPAKAVGARIEDVAPPGRAEADFPIQVITARAFAPLSRIIGHAKPWLDRGALGLFLKGEDVEAELAEARKTWALKVDLLPSLSDPRGRIVRVEGAERVGPT